MKNMHFDALLVILTAACSSDCFVPPISHRLGRRRLASRGSGGLSQVNLPQVVLHQVVLTKVHSSGGLACSALVLGRWLFSRRLVSFVSLVVGCLTYRKLEATSLLRPPTLRLGHFILLRVPKGIYTKTLINYTFFRTQ